VRRRRRYKRQQLIFSGVFPLIGFTSKAFKCMHHIADSDSTDYCTHMFPPPSTHGTSPEPNHALRRTDAPCAHV
jgi:hypothetical protein